MVFCQSLNFCLQIFTSSGDKTLGTIQYPFSASCCLIKVVFILGLHPKFLDKKFDNEEIQQADLSSAEAIFKLTKDIDCVVHMGGQSIEGSWDNVLNSNIIGMYNLYEGCRKNNVKRVIWASSVHTVGFYPRAEVIDNRVMPRPDSNYGLSKVFGESLAQYYWDKYKLETVSIRIYSCVAEPKDHRMLSTWLSYNDLRSLVISCMNTASAVSYTHLTLPAKA